MNIPNALKRAALVVVLIATFTAAAFADGHLRTRTLDKTDQPLVFPVPQNRSIKIVNFIQDGTLEPRGKISVSKDGHEVTVLGATFGGAESEFQKDLFIEGPAQVTVTPAGAALFLSYKLIAR